MVNIPFNPPWKEYEQDLLSDDVKKSRKAADAFDNTRKKETESSQKARNWEADRKKSWANDKPGWIKMKNKEDAIKSMSKDIKDFGSLNYNIRPFNGYILIKIINKQQETISGILIPESAEEKNQIAEILAVGGPIILSAKVTIEAGVDPGDKVLLKKFAGIDITVKNEPLKLCQFNDILGILE